MVLRKDELEVQLKDEHQLIRDGVLKDDSPLDSTPNFLLLCDACRRGDLKTCQEMISLGTNINARDRFDYTPLILASLCGHYEVVQLLLEAGALCERDTFQGERCLYNALNNRIRNLLLQYDYSKSTDPLQPLASHITGLLNRRIPQTSDIGVTAASEVFNLHKFILSARSPYFQRKFAAAPESTTWKVANTIPAEAFHVALRYLYLGDIPTDLGIGARSFVTEEEVFKGIDKISKQLEIESLWQSILAGNDRRIARQRHQDEVERGRNQLNSWYKNNVVKNKILVDTNRAQDVRWTRQNSIFADVLLRADEPLTEDDIKSDPQSGTQTPNGNGAGIPIGLFSSTTPAKTSTKPARKSTLYPVHRAMLIRSEYFLTMFSSQFAEAQPSDHLLIINVDCSPAVLEIVLDFLYTESANIPLDLAIDVLFAADMLFIEKLKTKAAVVISTLGSAKSSALTDRTHAGIDNGIGAISNEVDVEPINVYDVIRAGWITRVQRLEEFAAKYLADRLEDYIDEEEFEELIQESAGRIQKRQETDSIELLDDIRYYLSDRFRLRFEDSGLEEMMDENGEIHSELAETIANSVTKQVPNDEAIDVTNDATEAQANVDEKTNQALLHGQIRTLDGEVAGDEFASDAINYQVLLGKIDTLLEKLKLDA